ncbi:MAG TPA: orotidine-5'-phosphate decarboxylase [Beijerinckiaceae bacterium]|jgi:orotidine-5'-phosphate decarboxylase|nr:orotidine-5'-phosphate decarboxylase [Beijerinckiaceae bacterium]
MSAVPIHPRDRLIVALDLPSVGEAAALVERLGDAVSFYKIGMELTYTGGLAFAERLIGEGKKVFLDLKLHDIGTTVERATAAVAKLGATFLTIHAFPQTMKAACRGRDSAGTGLTLLAVTVMTSYDNADLAEAGYAMGVADLVARRAEQAKAIGIDGLILAATEAASIRAIVGPQMLLVTPGIRPAGADADDQKRIMTPSRAIAAGADHLVVGRPVTGATDPRGAAQAIVAEIAGVTPERNLSG